MRKENNEDETNLESSISFKKELKINHIIPHLS